MDELSHTLKFAKSFKDTMLCESLGLIRFLSFPVMFIYHIFDIYIFIYYPEWNVPWMGWAHSHIVLLNSIAFLSGITWSIVLACSDSDFKIHPNNLNCVDHTFQILSCLSFIDFMYTTTRYSLCWLIINWKEMLYSYLPKGFGGVALLLLSFHKLKTDISFLANELHRRFHLPLPQFITRLL